MASSPTPPPEKRQARCSPFLLIVITCIVVGIIVLFLVYRPAPSGPGKRNTTVSPAAAQQ